MAKKSATANPAPAAKKSGAKTVSETVSEKALFFDAGPVISLVMSRLAWLLPELKKRWGGKFYITPAVKYELIDRPLTVRRFEFEALQVMKMIREGVLEVYPDVPSSKVSDLIKLANSSFSVDKKTIDIIQEGEMESAAAAVNLKAAAVVMDERTLRLMIESNRDVKALLESRFQRIVVPDLQKMDLFSSKLKDLKIIRSIELVAIAYRLGLLDGYIPEGKNGRAQLIDAVLWNVKYNGCAVTENEIQELKQFLLGR